MPLKLILVATSRSADLSFNFLPLEEGQRAGWHLGQCGRAQDYCFSAFLGISVPFFSCERQNAARGGWFPEIDSLSFSRTHHLSAASPNEIIDEIKACGTVVAREIARPRFLPATLVSLPSFLNKIRARFARILYPRTRLFFLFVLVFPLYLRLEPWSSMNV